MTGGFRGIGRAIALQLGRLGASVAIGYLKQGAAAEAMAAEIGVGVKSPFDLSLSQLEFLLIVS